MDLIDILDRTGILRVEESDGVLGITSRNRDGSFSAPLVEILRAKNPEKVRVSHVHTEINDKHELGFQLDPRIREMITTYRRRIIYLFGKIISDEPITETYGVYEGGRIRSWDSLVHRELEKQKPTEGYFE